jgi:hypothetical protein
MYLKSEVSENSSGLYSAGVEWHLLRPPTDRETGSKAYRTLLLMPIPLVSGAPWNDL